MPLVLTAGMRNNNPGNIKFRGYPGTTPSANLDQGDPQAVYPTVEAGMQAMYQLLLKKYGEGKRTPRQIIYENQGWTPGNLQAAQNIANSAGIGLDDDINLTNPASALKFMRGLVRQEHGQASDMYTDQMLTAAIAAQPPATPAREDPRRDTPSSGKPTGSQLPGPLPTTAPPAQTPQPPVPVPAPVPAPLPRLYPENDPWSSLASGLASSVRPSASGLAGSDLPEAAPTPPPDFASAIPEAPPPPAVGLPGTAQGAPMANLADLFTVDPSRFGQAAILNVDRMGQPIRTRQYG